MGKCGMTKKEWNKEEYSETSGINKEMRYT
jgi:hypothetical protein